MKSYTLYVHDRRYRVPTLLAADFSGDARARAFAEERLKSSLYYLSIEVWRDDKLLFHLRGDESAAAP